MSASERRQRVSIACTPCRKKKCRCDGEKPTCRVCERDGDPCDYTHQEKRNASEQLEASTRSENHSASDEDMGWFSLPLNDVFLVDGVSWDDILNEEPG